MYCFCLCFSQDILIQRDVGGQFCLSRKHAANSCAVAEKHNDGAVRSRWTSEREGDSPLMSALAACGGKRQGGRQWLTEHFRVQGTAVLKENSDDLHLIAEKPGASAGRAGQRHRWAPAPLGCHLQRAAAICSTPPRTRRKLIFWQNTGINMTFKQVVLSQA